MSEDATIGDVSDTAFWVAYYRAKESENSQPLFRDPLAKALVGTRGKALAEAMPTVGRYTEWTVIARTVIIDRFIEQALKEGVDAIVNLGAGLDTRPYRMNLPKDLQWIEVDYANIIEHKNKNLESEKPKCQLTRVALDLADVEQRREFFNRVATDAKAVFILTEGVIPYLTPDQVTSLAQDLLVQKRFTYWATEYFHPRVYSYLKDSIRQARMKNAPFRFFPDEWYAFFANIGWVEKETRYASEIAIEFKRKMPMPKIAELMMWILPEKVKAQAHRMSGFMVFKRKTDI